jgi:recombination protein RecR
MRYHSGKAKVCSICSSEKRDAAYLAVVASDADLSALERSDTYKGLYFVLGGTISLASEKTSGLRLEKLLALVSSRSNGSLKEVILAFPANPEGDATAVRVHEEIAAAAPELRITSLGRGLSTGSELEYADPETIKSAFDSRK